MKFYVYDYTKDGISDSEAIRNCLEDSKKQKKRTIVFDRRNWMIDEAILLPSDTTVIIDDCTIKQTDETFDNIFRGDNLVLNPEDPYGCPIDIKEISNIKILGKGRAVLEGPELNKVGYHTFFGEEQVMVGDFWGWRTHQISISMCKNFELGNVAILKTRGWAVSFDVSENIYIHDIEFFSRVKNGDGIDFRSGCHNCLVENITGETSDDTVACTALASKETSSFMTKSKFLYPSEPTRKMRKRVPEDYDISNVIIKNVCTQGSEHELICLAAEGCNVYNVLIENIKEPENGTGWRESAVKVYTGYGRGYTSGDLHDITIKNVHSTYSDCAVYCNTEVENVALENINHKDSSKKYRIDYPDGIDIKEEKSV